MGQSTARIRAPQKPSPPRARHLVHKLDMNVLLFPAQHPTDCILESLLQSAPRELWPWGKQWYVCGDQSTNVRHAMMWSDLLACAADFRVRGVEKKRLRRTHSTSSHTVFIARLCSTARLPNQSFMVISSWNENSLSSYGRNIVS
jgi:hypothetical protein